MSTKAGHLFICGVCKCEFSESESRYDEELKSPVCADCDKQLKWSKAWLSSNKIKPCTYVHNNRIGK